MTNLKVSFFLTLILATLIFVATSKSNKLVLLAYTPFNSENTTLMDNICSNAMMVAVDEVNSNARFLPDYEIVVDVRPEGVLGTKGPRQLIEFFDAFDQGKFGSENTFISPAVVGEYYICQSISGIVREHKMVQFSTWCAGTLFTGDRKNYPNLYRQVTPQEGHFASQLHLIKNLGHWKRIGIVYFAGNISEFLVANFLYQLFESFGIFIPWFASAIEANDDLIDSLEESNVRVILLGFYEGSRLLEFLCVAARHKLFTPKYAFIAYSNAFKNPWKIDNFPDNCTKEMVLEVMKGVIWVGNFEALTPGIDKYTSLRYNNIEFDQRLDRRINYSRTVDYSRRMNCHDAMLHALVALDETDFLLNQQYKLGLKDFKTYPDLVMNVLNYSAATVHYEGLQHRLHYSDRIEADHRFQAIAQLDFDDKELHLITRLWFQGHSSSLLKNLDEYEINELEPLRWYTPNHQPTNDLSEIQHRILGVSNNISLITLMALFGVFLITIFISFLKRQGIYGVSDQPLVNFILVFSPILTNAASILFLIQPTDIICDLAVILATMGIALINSSLFGKMLLLSRFLKYSKQTRRITRGQMLELLKSQKHRGFYVKIEEAVFLALNVVVLAVWTGTDYHLKAIEFTSSVAYDAKNDIYYDTTTSTCYSDTKFYWVTALIGLNSIPLLISLVMAYNMRHVAVPSFLKIEVWSLRVATSNAVTLIVLWLILNFLFDETIKNNLLLAHSVLIYGNLIALSTLFASFITRFKKMALNHIGSILLAHLQNFRIPTTSHRTPLPNTHQKVTPL